MIDLLIFTHFLELVILDLIFARIVWYFYYSFYEGRPESKDRLRIALAQVNNPRRFKVARPQSSIGFVPSKFSTDCII
jgi:hypothetical protein